MTAATLRIVKTTDEPRYDETAGFANDAELALSLDAGASYWFEACIIGRASSLYASQLQGKLHYTGTLYDPGVHISAISNDSYYVNGYQLGYRNSLLLSQLSFDNFQDIDNTTGNSSALRGAFWYSGRITCTTGGILTFSWKHYDNGFAGASNPSIVYAGSWMYVTPLDICPI